MFYPGALHTILGIRKGRADATTYREPPRRGHPSPGKVRLRFALRISRIELTSHLNKNWLRSRKKSSQRKPETRLASLWQRSRTSRRQGYAQGLADKERSGRSMRGARISSASRGPSSHRRPTSIYTINSALFSRVEAFLPRDSAPCSRPGALPPPHPSLLACITSSTSQFEKYQYYEISADNDSDMSTTNLRRAYPPSLHRCLYGLCGNSLRGIF